MDFDNDIMVNDISIMTALACVREGSQGQEVGDLSCPMHLGQLLSAPW